jgi:hypothetical protein
MDWRTMGLATLAALLLAGCGSSGHTLNSSASVAPFVANVARGGHLDWSLASDASPEARRVWLDKARLREASAIVREWPGWGCKVLGMLRERIRLTLVVLAAEKEGASVFTANEVIPTMQKLIPTELDGLRRALC